MVFNGYGHLQFMTAGNGYDHERLGTRSELTVSDEINAMRRKETK